MQLDFRMVDVFSEQPFLGNPVAVVLGADDLSSEQMQRITRWFNLSETTFLLEPEHPEADYRVRIFTLERELPFAGHPTLGSCRAWLSAGGQPTTTPHIVQQCAAGLVRIRRDGEQYAFEAPPIQRYDAPDESTRSEVLRFLNLQPDQVEDMRWVDNGPGWIGVRLKSAAEVLAIEGPGHYPQRIDVGLVGPCPPGSAYDFELRALFSDHRGSIIEDPVTGSLNASVAQWLLDTGVASGPYCAGQGQKVGRDGRIQVTPQGDSVWIGGRTHVVVEGRIDLQAIDTPTGKVS